jgi:glutathione S-transferase
MSKQPLRVVGAPGSPYTRKLRAVLRYRRIPHEFVLRNSREDHDVPAVPVALIPVLVFPAEGAEPPQAMLDTTFQIRRLEEQYAERSVIHPDPALAFLDALLEDYGDEWLTKAMFHYRWAYAADVHKAGAILPLWSRTNLPSEALAKFSRTISERQVSRLWVVGSNETTGPVIEASYRRLLRAFDAHLEQQPFLMGARPGSADFGFYGQLTQLALFDPTPMAVTLEEAPRVYAWTERMEDLSGAEALEDDWFTRETLPDTLRALLAEVGRVYAPFLMANAAALEAGAEQVECEIDGQKWVQKPFPYQGKCLRWLREQYAALAAPDRDFVDEVLAGSGCEVLFQ